MQEVLLDLPGLLFFSTYTLLVLFWAEIYHQARSLSTTALRPMFVAFNAVVYAVQVCRSLLPACALRNCIVCAQSSAGAFTPEEPQVFLPLSEKFRRQKTLHPHVCTALSSILNSSKTRCVPGA